jgi:hypothetical protein
MALYRRVESCKLKPNTSYLLTLLLFMTRSVLQAKNLKGDIAGLFKADSDSAATRVIFLQIR